MPNLRTLQRSFAGGELSPEMLGAIGDSKYQTGAARARNFVLKPTGAAVRRPGTGFVREVSDSTKQSCLRPFKFGVSDTMALNVALGHFRFHTQGGTLTYATAHTVLSVDTGANTITFTAPHNMTTGTDVRFVNSSGVQADLPDPLDTVTYTITVVDALTVSVNTITLLDAGINTTYMYRGDEMPRDYVTSKNVSSVNAGTDEITFGSAHELLVGDAIKFTVSGGTIITNVVAGTTYYAIIVSPTVIKLAETEAAAIAGTPVFNIGAIGTGTTKMHKVYTQGDLAYWEGAGHGVFYCTADVASDTAPPSDTAHWYLEPRDGVYEVQHAYSEANGFTGPDLFDLNYDQKQDSITFAHRLEELGTLTRVSALRWIFVQTTTYGSLLPKPVINSPIARTFGSNQEFTGDGATPTLFTSTNGQSHGFVVGDPVYAESKSGGVGGGGSFGASPVYPAGFYEIAHTGHPTPGLQHINLRLREVDGGAAIGPVSGASHILLRYASLSSETTYRYRLTAVDVNGVESEPSEYVEASNNLSVTGATNTITWPAITDAVRYRVYKKQNGLYGVIGENIEMSFVDDNIAPDMGFTLPIEDDVLGSSAVNQPGAVTRFEQRRCFAATTNSPQQMWLTATGSETALIYHLPLIDSDRISFVLSSPEAIRIRHMVPLANLNVFTDWAEYVVTPVNQDAITPLSFRARAVTYRGSSTVRPLVVNNTILFCGNRGGHVYEFGRTQDAGYTALDVALRSAHLFDNLTIADSALMKSPYQIAWFVSSNGKLLGLTYVPEEGVGGWHWHDTDGLFESCCVVAEGTEDVLYVIVKRTINGVTKRYVERMAQFAVGALEDCFHVDCGLTYSGTAATDILGLDHLEAKTVSILANGVIQDPELVAAGAITLDATTTKAHIGLPFTSELRTLPVAAQVDIAFGQGRTKNVNKVWLRVVNTCRFEAGPDTDQFIPTTDIAESAMVTDEVDVAVEGDWTNGGQLWLRQEDPVPMTVVSLCAEVSIGS